MKKRLLFFITEDWYFWSHRLPIARAARDAGFDVLIVTRAGQYKERIEAEGFKLIPIGLERKSKNIFKEIRVIMEIIKIYRKEKPDIVHHVAIKPVLYGSFAAQLTGVAGIVNAVAGLGFIFVERGFKVSILRYFVILAYRLAFFKKNIVGIFQNPEDLKFFVDAKIAKRKRTVLIRGSGVDTSRFVYVHEPSGIPVVVLASRMLWKKGVGHFVEAAKILKGKGVQCRMVLAGNPDLENPGFIPEKTLRFWHSEGMIEWWGHKEDMAEVFAQSNIVALPTTYGEGVPKVLIEAASCGRAIVATDVPGCREIVRHEQNGFLISPDDPKILAETLKTLIEDPGLRMRMGAHGRKIAEDEFSEKKVVQETMDVYKKFAVENNFLK